MCKKKKIGLIKLLFCMILCAMTLVCVMGCTSNAPSYHIKYKITNMAGIEDTSSGQGLTFENTFEVSGTIEIQNYDTDLIVVTAKACGNKGSYIPIFTTININGDGIYSFTMSSYYRNGVDWVTKIFDIEVKEA